MGNLLLFLKKQAHWFLFAFLSIFCFILIYQSLNYQRYVLSGSVRVLSAPVYQVWSGVTKHFKLNYENEILIKQNQELMNLLSSSFIENKDTSYTAGNLTKTAMYTYTNAHVISNSSGRKNNYLVLDKGFKDGIRNDMAVITPQGIVGVVNNVSEHFSSVISLLHTESRISARVLPLDYIGTVVWFGDNPQEVDLTDIPYHLKVNVGDSVVTSGYSLVFPKDIFIGTIKSITRSQNSSFYSVKVKLAVNYNHLHSVYVIKNEFRTEIDSLKSHFKND